MKSILHLAALCCASVFATSATAHHSSLGNTVYILPELITDDDPSRLKELDYVGEVENMIWDHITEEEYLRDAWAFDATFSDGTSVRFNANMAYDDFDTAAEHVEILAFVIGQMPHVCRDETYEIDVNPTGDDWSASPGEMTIDMGSLDQESEDGALEESMLHECVHTSLDVRFEDDPAWEQAQKNDAAFISDYAEENPDGEDLAETITMYYGLLYYFDRFDDDLLEIINTTIPHRMEYLRENLPKHDLRF